MHCRAPPITPPLGGHRPEHAAMAMENVGDGSGVGGADGGSHSGGGTGGTGEGGEKSSKSGRESGRGDGPTKEERRERRQERRRRQEAAASSSSIQEVPVSDRVFVCRECAVLGHLRGRWGGVVMAFVGGETRCNSGGGVKDRY